MQKLTLKKNKKTVTVVFIAAVLIGAVIGFAITSGMLFKTKASPKTFTTDGMNITLTDEFFESNPKGYTAVYDTKDIVVYTLKESFDILPAFKDFSIEEYGEMIAQVNSLGSAEIKTADNLTYFEYDYTNEETKNSYHYVSFVYKAHDAFWFIQFATLAENAETFSPQIFDWAKTVKFEE